MYKFSLENFQMEKIQTGAAYTPCWFDMEWLIP